MKNKCQNISCPRLFSTYCLVQWWYLNNVWLFILITFYITWGQGAIFFHFKILNFIIIVKFTFFFLYKRTHDKHFTPIKFACVRTQSYVTFCNSMDCSPPGSSIHGISKQEYGSGLPFPSPGESSQPRDPSCISYTADEFFTTEPQGEP